MKRILFQYKWYIAAAIVVGMLTMLFFLDPSRYVLMPKCPFKLITGCRVQAVAFSVAYMP